jgi:hypothetical protein
MEAAVNIRPSGTLSSPFDHRETTTLDRKRKNKENEKNKAAYVTGFPRRMADRGPRDSTADATSLEKLLLLLWNGGASDI